MTSLEINASEVQPLARLLAAAQPSTLGERLMLGRRLASAVQALHRQGCTHRALDGTAVMVDGRLQPRLSPAAGPRRFGADQSDPEFCPPELAQGVAVELPSDIAAAAAILKERGLAVDPRRVDVYQIGVLLCQLLTGEPLVSYRYSTSVKAKVPPEARAVLDRCLGEDPVGPFTDCDSLLEALDGLIARLAEVAPLEETPPHGSFVDVLAETPPQGILGASSKALPVGGMPCERLGHFQILQRIGHGGMGDVYKGYDATLDRYVAIKVLPAALARDEDFVRRFRAEATAVARLSHPNVVAIHFIGEDAGHHFFAMQFIEGESLGQQLVRDRRLPLDQAVAIIEQCLAGLEAAHAQGLVHRDVKPGNVLMDRRHGRAVLVDFGLVRQIGATGQSMTATGVVMGTVDYIAPEQARGQAVDGRSDIYSLGVMFYQLLSGRLPFKADTPTAMIFQHAYEEPLPLATAAPEVPEAVTEIIARMMAKLPAERYPSCAAVLADLRAVREGRPLEAPPAVEPADAEGVVDEPSLPYLPPDTPWQRVQDWAATIFRRHAPQALRDLQGTSQQIDGAVAHYERRCKSLEGLLTEIRNVVDELATQIGATEQAAEQLAAEASGVEDPDALHAKQQSCQEDLAALRAQHREQQERLAETQLDLDKALATLVRLRSQRDLLNARLRTAQAQSQAEGPSAADHRRRIPIAVAALAVLGVGFMAFWSLPSRPGVPEPSGGAGPIEPPSGVPPVAMFPFDENQAKAHQLHWANYLGVPVQMTNSIGMKFVLIPPGEFDMGSTQDFVVKDLGLHGADPVYRERLPGESPLHRVRITKPFWLGITEVTQQEFQRVMGNNPSQFSGDPNRPVERVSWHDGGEFCRRLGGLPEEKEAGRRYALPTEAQWEYGCRAGSSTRWSLGGQHAASQASDEENALHEYGWFDGNPSDSPHPVAQLRANAWGLFDMHGNVWEWCRDRYDRDYYTKSPSDDPAGPAAGSRVVTRGGCWATAARYARSTYRHEDGPDDCGGNRGFRVAMLLPDKPPELKIAVQSAVDLPPLSADAVDLLSTVSPKHDAFEGRWTHADNELSIKSWGRICLQPPIHGDYDLDLEFTRREGHNELLVMLPVGPTSCNLVLNGYQGSASGLQHIDFAAANVNPTRQPPLPLLNGRRYRLAVRVRTTDTDASIAVDFEGRPYIRWEGPFSLLSTTYGVLDPYCIGLGLRDTTVHVAKVRLGPSRTAPGSGWPPVFGKDVGGAPLPNVTLASAGYGSRRTTALVRWALARDPFSGIQADSNFTGDPAVGWRKHFSGSYRVGGVDKKFSLQEWEVTTVPALPSAGLPLPEASQEFKVLAARYGAGLVWMDITEKVRKWVSDPAQPVEFSGGRVGRDPRPSATKSFITWFDYQGRRYVRVFGSGKRVLLPPPKTDKDSQSAQGASKAAQAESLKTIKDIYGDDLAQAKSDEQKTALAKKMIDKADQNTDLVGAGRFELLKAAADLASEAGDAATALHAADALGPAFEAESLTLKADILAKAAKKAQVAGDRTFVAEKSLEVLAQAVAADQFQAAAQFGRLAMEAAQQLGDQALIGRAGDRAREADELAKTYAEVQQATKVLDAQPTDPAANLTVGRYHCFIKADWYTGLPMLAACGDPTIQALALRELQDPAAPDEQSAIADAWWDLAEGQKGLAREQIRARADFWYQKALPGLTALPKAKAESRLARASDPAEGIESAAIPTGAVLLLTFDKTSFFQRGSEVYIKDLSGMENHALLHGGTPTDGRVGQALAFKGPEEYVECQDSPSLNLTQAVSICAWIKVHEWRSGHLVSKDEWVGDIPRGYVLRTSDNGIPNFTIGGGGSWQEFIVGNRIESDKWHHLAATFDGRRMTVYTDGVSQGSKDCVQSITPSTYPLRIPSCPFDPRRDLDGILDEVAIFARGLTDREIQAVYKMGLQGKPLAE